MKNYGLMVEADGRDGFKVTRYGRRFWCRTFNTRRTAQGWLKRAVAECRIDPLAGVHFADEATCSAALRDAVVRRDTERAVAWGGFMSRESAETLDAPREERDDA